jgi:glucosamine 6-phosphate synthetase-like amidotransferase/phosphosugar isomerase protein
MCGLAAILLHPLQRTAAQWQAIRQIMTRNLIANEVRGIYATGAAVIGANGKVALDKQALRASEYITTPGYRGLMERIGSQTTLILGHTRLPTKGNPAFNNNNHPLYIEPVIGIHNGQIDNDDALFAKFDFPRQTEVDSEIIFQLLGPLDPQLCDGGYLQNVKSCLHLLDGQFTFLASDRRRPEQLLVVRHNNPLCLHYDRELGILVFSSRYLFLRREFGLSFTNRELHNDHLMLFNAYDVARLGSQPAEISPL